MSMHPGRPSIIKHEHLNASRGSCVPLQKDSACHTGINHVRRAPHFQLEHARGNLIVDRGGGYMHHPRLVCTMSVTAVEEPPAPVPKERHSSSTSISLEGDEVECRSVHGPYSSGGVTVEVCKQSFVILQPDLRSEIDKAFLSVNSLHGQIPGV